MDPDENLTQQRALLKKINEGRPLYDDTQYVEDLIRLAELVEAMDEWLRQGGFLPRAWAEEQLHG